MGLITDELLSDFIMDNDHMAIYVSNNETAKIINKSVSEINKSMVKLILSKMNKKPDIDELNVLIHEISTSILQPIANAYVGGYMQCIKRVQFIEDKENLT